MKNNNLVTLVSSRSKDHLEEIADIR